MVNTSPAIRRLAKQLLVGAPQASPNDDLDQAVLVCEKLSAPLTTLVGTAGFSMLLSRAMALAMQKDPSLTPLRVGNDGTLAGIDAVRETLNGSRSAHERGVIVVTELLGLLVSFIGGSLTLTLVREVWPDAWLDLTDSTRESS